jgi:hypothetical protein
MLAARERGFAAILRDIPPFFRNRSTYDTSPWNSICSIVVC